MAEVIVFTDLDGTLLDHESYGVRAALPALDLLNRRGLPVIPVSSKTAAEIRRWVRLLDLEGPFISENGCCIVVPTGCLTSRPAGATESGAEWRISLGEGIEFVKKSLRELSQTCGFEYKSLDQMSEMEMSVLTGLTGDELSLSLEREYDMPFVLSGEYDLELIAREAAAKGFHFTRGGRFYHLTGGCHKGTAVRMLADFYREERPEPLFVGIGDSFNDLPMFEEVDMAFLVQKPDGSYDPLVPEEAARRVLGVGPRGWRAAVEEVMSLG